MADALPAELGVLTPTADPGGATYDGTNHVMTWNWQNTPNPKFDKLDPGQEIAVTFQVYLRQKPGFCWDESDFAKTRAYQVKPIERCPTDPYKVVDGAALEDVTGTWYTGAPLGTGFQAKVDFNGLANEQNVVVYGVRPIFDIEKVLFDPPQPMDVGQIAYFDIRVQNLDRHPRYDGLMGTYPEEFNGKVRDNPYGREVMITDVFDEGLDFVSAGNLTVTDDDGVNPPADYAASFVPDKGIKWATIPLLGGGDKGAVRISLRANLPSPAQPAEETGLSTRCNWNPGWHNCAFLDARNLNQPEREGMDWKDIELRPWYFSPLHRNLHEGLRYGIRDCATVIVIKKGDPWIELSTLGEWATPAPGGFAVGEVHQGQTYYYAMSIYNHGEAVAEGVSFYATLASGKASFNTNLSDHLVFEWVNPGWVFRSNAITATSTKVEFGSVNLAPGHILLHFLRAHADYVGNADATGQVDYHSTGFVQDPFMPDEVMESTQIAP